MWKKDSPNFGSKDGRVSHYTTNFTTLLTSVLIISVPIRKQYARMEKSESRIRGHAS